MKVLRNRLPALVFAAALFAGLVGATGRSAASHQSIFVREVFAGTVDRPLAQFIELQMYAGGQNDVAGKTIRIIDSANGAFLYTFSDNMAVGTNQTSILVATSEAERLFGMTADLWMHPVLSRSGGKVCYTGSDDCASWGSFSGSAEGSGTPFNRPAGIEPGRSMERSIADGNPTLLDAADDTNDSAADFVHSAPSPRNNAGGGGIADPTPAPTPTPTPTPAPEPSASSSQPPQTAEPPTCNGKVATTTREGTAGDDVFIGTEDDDEFDGGGGNDTICGLGGDDVLGGFLGDDYVDGGAGSDVIYGCHSSHGRSDAIVCYDDFDADSLTGGDGDDHLFGQIGGDDLTGGAGYDVLDGGEATDDCGDGERYARCETENPPAPPPACMDGIDNDDDDAADLTDSGCSRPRDPTEDVTADPECFNGNDDDDNGERDYPEDLGCTSFSDRDEATCLFCIPPLLDAGFDAQRDEFRGRVSDRARCATDRLVLVRRIRAGSSRTVATARTARSGRWRVSWSGPAGRYFAVVRHGTYHTASGDDPECERLRSRTFRV